MFLEVCDIEKISNDECRSLTHDEHEYFIIRKDDVFFGYRNQCPHLGTTLEFVPNQFLSADKSLIQCSMHGALFTIDEGLCISGPCEGQQLMPKPLRIDAGKIWLQHQND